ncbi:MAG: phosphatidylglycerol lysyltransferase domain-containing protein, partial [Desulfomonilaceae bacterium]
IDGKVEAFSFGEMLNPQTAVIHVEKANPEIPELYTAINQMFAMHSWSGVKYVNREQDLGLEGLRKAKESYYPDHLVEKYILRNKD